MPMGGEGSARPKVTRKSVVGLFCGGAFHDVAFTRVGGCKVVKLYDWELRMRKVARSFFPEEGVVRDMDIRAENVGVLMADIGSAVPADDWLKMVMDKTPASEWRPRPWHVRVRGSPRPLAIWRVRVRAASASAGVRSGVRWRPRPSRVRVHGTSASTARLRPLPSASTARPRPRHVHVHGASASAAVRVRVRFCVCTPAARRVTGRSLPRKDINPTPGGLDLPRPANQTQDGGAQLLAEGGRSPGGT